MLHTNELDDFYKQQWDIDSIEAVTDKERQMLGIDKVLYLKDGTTINIDEKIESIRNTSNIVFEDKTDIERDVSGWLKDGQLTDYVVFYQVEMKKVYLIPFDLMLKQYKESKDKWMERGLDRRVMNKTDYGFYQGRIFIVDKLEVYAYLLAHEAISKYESFEFDFPPSTA